MPQPISIEDREGDQIEVNKDGSINTRIKDAVGAGITFDGGTIPVTVVNDSGSGNEVLTSQKNTLFSISNYWGNSEKRNISSTTGSPILTVSGAELIFSVTGASDRIVFDSLELGTPVHGNPYESEISLRLPSVFTGVQSARWGYFDDSEGFYFGYDSTGIYCAFKRNGTEQSKTYQSGWSNDVLNGSGASLLTLSLLDGNNYICQTSCNEYGTINFFIELNNGSNGEERRILVHRINPSSNINIGSHNKPIRVEVLNAGSLLALGGKSFSIYGENKPIKRSVQHSRINVGGLSTTPSVLFVVRRISGKETVPIKFTKMTCISTIDVFIEIFKNSTFSSTGAFSAPGGFSSGEVATEVTSSVTGFSGGIKQKQDLFKQNGDVSELDLNFDRDSFYTFTIKRISGNGGSATINVDWEEMW